MCLCMVCMVKKCVACSTCGAASQGRKAVGLGRAGRASGDSALAISILAIEDRHDGLMAVATWPTSPQTHIGHAAVGVLPTQRSVARTIGHTAVGMLPTQRSVDLPCGKYILVMRTCC